LDHGARRTLRNKDGQTAPQLATSPEMKAPHLRSPQLPRVRLPAAKWSVSRNTRPMPRSPLIQPERCVQCGVGSNV
jgi:hypothetical protein